MQKLDYLFTKKLWEYFRLLTSEQQKELADRVKRLDLAIKINPGPEFIIESVEQFFEDYPIVKNCLKELNKIY